MNSKTSFAQQTELAREVVKIAVQAIVENCATPEKRERALWRIIATADRLQTQARGYRNVYSIRDGGRPLQDERRTLREQASDLSREIAADLLHDIASQRREMGIGR